MAKQQAVWGIDLGQYAFKALRCVLSEDKERVEANAFEYYEYPKPLRQAEPDEAEEMVQEALQRFLERNEIRGDRVVLGVPGQMGLARFVKIPPVELARIPDIVRYEARQQIPFDLEEVVWDYQRMAGGQVHEGFVTDAGVGFFAMKRDQVFRALEPFDQAGIEVDVIQLAPLAVFNFAAFDVLPHRDESEYDPENPPPSIMIISFGTENSDLVITDGFHVWQRPIPIGGNHFTKAITKEFKQTFAKAEHIKRNASHFENPKALFQAMRPVFTDLATEIQRSLNYFSNINRSAKIKRGIAVGNVAKLPGLMRFLSQNLQLPVERLDQYSRLQGAQVTDSPAFKENMLSLAVSYGLCVQGLGVGKLTTNLMPPEILRDRLIRAKKPWVVAAAAALLLGFGVHLSSHALALYTVDEQKFSAAESQAQGFVSQVNSFRTRFDQGKQEFETIDKIGQHLIQTQQRQQLWLQLLTALNAAIPKDDPSKPVENLTQEKQLHVEEVFAQEIRVVDWLADNLRWLPKEMQPEEEELGGNAAGDTGIQDASSGAGVGETTTPPGAPAGPGGMGGLGEQGSQVSQQALQHLQKLCEERGYPEYAWMVRVRGYHYHNATPGEEGPLYVEKTLVKNLQLSCGNPQHAGDSGRVCCPVGIGICCPIQVNIGKINREYEIPNPDYDPMRPDSDVPQTLKVPRYDFEVQFLWIPGGLKKEQSGADSTAQGVGGVGTSPTGAVSTGGNTGSVPGGAPAPGTAGATVPSATEPNQN